MSLVTRHVSQFGLRHSGSNFYVHWHAQPHTLFECHSYTCIQFNALIILYNIYIALLTLKIPSHEGRCCGKEGHF